MAHQKNFLFRMDTGKDLSETRALTAIWLRGLENDADLQKEPPPEK